MNRSTIDYGIDLGTTNSCLARLDGVTPVVIKNSHDQDITPSAVSFKKSGAKVIGHLARNRLQFGDGVVTEFKRPMGTPHQYDLKHAPGPLSPEALSAEVLKAFRELSSSSGDDLLAAVITVPAAFELHQCDATKRAAELAGFEQCVLLQEPVAASLAFGFQAESRSDYWLVYDFGGGTFDAAIIRAEDGLINVVDHGGDNFLGGADIDWAVMKEIIVPRLQSSYNLPDFVRGSDRWKTEQTMLKWAVENAKISLSTQEEVELEPVSFTDADGEEVDLEEIRLTRADLIRVAEPIIRRSTDITRRVLAGKNLEVSALDRIILVGGPTKAPYFREILEDALGVALAHEIDPMTVVAQGAAIFAGTQPMKRKSSSKAAPDVLQVELTYKPVDCETEPMVGGKLNGTEGFEGLEIEFTNEESGWKSGRLPISGNGSFMTELVAERWRRNTFRITVTDASGKVLATDPDHLHYTVGAVASEQPLIHSIGLALADNRVAPFFEKGAPLPASKTFREPFRTTVEVRAGSQDELLRIPIIEGERSDAADRNACVGELAIDGSEIRRNLPAGSEVEVTLKIDESRKISLTAFVPALDEEFSTAISLTAPKADPERMARSIRNELRRHKEVADKAEATESRDVSERLEVIRTRGLVRELEERQDELAGDPAAAGQAQARMLELQSELDELEELLKWPELVANVEDASVRLERLAADHGTPAQKRKAEDLGDQIEAIIHRRDVRRLTKKLDEIEELIHEILFSMPEFWVHQFRVVGQEIEALGHPGDSRQLLQEGKACIRQGDVDGLKQTVVELIALLPREVAEVIQRGFGSTVTN